MPALIPLPARRFSRKALVIIGLVFLLPLLVLLGIVFIPWDIKPIDDMDLQLKIPTLSPEENAFAWFEKAGNAQVDSCIAPDGKKLTFDDVAKNPDPALLAKVLAANEAVFIDLEKGLACRQYASHPTEPHETLFWLKKLKVSEELLSFKSKQSQSTGDYAGAAKSALQGFRLGQQVSGNSNSLIEWLVGVACQSIALERLEELAADAKTQESMLREIQASLNGWDHAGIIAGYGNGMRGEYRYQHLAMKAMLTGKGTEEIEGAGLVRNVPWLLKLNMMNRDIAALFRHLIQSIGLPRSEITKDYPGKEKLAESQLSFDRPNSIGKIQVLMLVPALEKSLDKKFQLQTAVVVLRLKIALRLYEQKHGQLPETLQALVPEFIPAVPNDPFDDKEFRYSKERKLVWSVGPDGVDNDGRSEDGRIMAPKPSYDLVMPLGTRELKPTPPPPPAPPESKPSQGSSDPF